MNKPERVEIPVEYCHATRDQWNATVDEEDRELCPVNHEAFYARVHLPDGRAFDVSTFVPVGADTEEEADALREVVNEVLERMGYTDEP